MIIDKRIYKKEIVGPPQKKRNLSKEQRKILDDFYKKFRGEEPKEQRKKQ